jgi:predicted nucleotidyltransferase
VNPTAFPELDAVLAQLVAGLRARLGDNLVGVYLQGSFAVGDADEHSDVDFLVVIERELTKDEQHELRALHERLFQLPSHWAKHLEGSYVPRDQLRRVDPKREPWFYFDNGATEPIWDNHDNSAVVRWSLREHGVVLDGPKPTTLVDPVSGDELRREIRWVIDDFGDWLRARRTWSARLQTLAVISYCRILHTLETGAVASKRQSGEWARETLGAEWSDLIQRALDDRPDPWAKVRDTADPGLVRQTLDFVDYAARRSRETPSAAR